MQYHIDIWINDVDVTILKPRKPLDILRYTLSTATQDLTSHNLNNRSISYVTHSRKPLDILHKTSSIEVRYLTSHTPNSHSISYVTHFRKPFDILHVRHTNPITARYLTSYTLNSRSTLNHKLSIATRYLTSHTVNSRLILYVAHSQQPLDTLCWALSKCPQNLVVSIGCRFGSTRTWWPDYWFCTWQMVMSSRVPSPSSNTTSWCTTVALAGDVKSMTCTRFLPCYTNINISWTNESTIYIS